jgi:hypothetical protein
VKEDHFIFEKGDKRISDDIKLLEEELKPALV